MDGPHRNPLAGASGWYPIDALIVCAAQTLSARGSASRRSGRYGDAAGTVDCAGCVDQDELPPFSNLASFRRFRCGAEDNPSSQSIPRFLASFHQFRFGGRATAPTDEPYNRCVPQNRGSVPSIPTWGERRLGHLVVFYRPWLRFVSYGSDREVAHTIDASRKIVASFGEIVFFRRCGWLRFIDFVLVGPRGWLRSTDFVLVGLRGWLRFVSYGSDREVAHTIDASRKIVASFGEIVFFRRCGWLRFIDFVLVGLRGWLRSIDFASACRKGLVQVKKKKKKKKTRHGSPFADLVPPGLTPDCIAKLIGSDLRARMTDLPTLRMPQVWDFMNADQEFPETASPDSGRACERRDQGSDPGPDPLTRVPPIKRVRRDARFRPAASSLRAFADLSGGLD